MSRLSPKSAHDAQCVSFFFLVLLNQQLLTGFVENARFTGNMGS